MVAFLFLMLQFQYVFYICCCSVPAQLPRRSCSVSSRAWFAVLVLSPFLATDNF
jgi:hypothetical protein